MTENRRRTEAEGVTHDLDHDLDADLFDFASVARSSDATAEREGEEGEGDTEDLDQVLASIRDTQAEQEAARAAAAPQPRSPAPASAAARPAAPARRLGDVAPALPSSAPRAQEGSRTLREPPTPVAAKRRRFSSVIAIALAVTFLNSALAVVVLRPPFPAGANERQAATYVPPAVEPRATPAGAPAQAHPSLDEAWAAVARGEYALARQRAYSLLALVDGIEGAERDQIENDCRYLIAQALYLDALSRREVSP